MEREALFQRKSIQIPRIVEYRLIARARELGIILNDLGNGLSVGNPLEWHLLRYNKTKVLEIP